jgi:hypothetical protein
MGLCRPDETECIRRFAVSATLDTAYDYVTLDLEMELQGAENGTDVLNQH